MSKSEKNLATMLKTILLSLFSAGSNNLIGIVVVG